jgi:class 3 adenylate cyclase/pimeloyl-ACP methyl ester carboxylesterase
MAQEKLPRRLAVILHADVAGYSRLTGADEDLTLRLLRDCLGLIATAVTDFRGRVINYAGDAVLAIFDAASDAVTCAADFQAALLDRNEPFDDKQKLQFRVGINLGDIIEDGSDIYGDGVNIAARLGTVAPPGGVCVSQAVRNAVGPNAPGRFLDIGPQSLKNIERPVHAFIFQAGDQADADVGHQISLADQAPVRYCTAVDGISLAHTEVGSGYPLVIAGAWMTHLEREWDDPAWRNYLSGLAENFQLIRYDQRGNGMSDWDGVEINFERMVDDLKTVIDLCAHDKVAIWGSSQGAAVAAACAARYPDRVSHLILYGGYARGRRRRGDPEATAESEALVTLIRQAWGRDNPAIRQTMTSMFMPDATAEEATWFNNFQRACGPADNIAQFREVFDSIDITDELSSVACPTLVIHCVGDAVAPLAEGKLLAARIPNADFITLKSDSHMMTDRDPEFPRCLEAVRRFMASVMEGREG